MNFLSQFDRYIFVVSLFSVLFKEFVFDSGHKHTDNTNKVVTLDLWVTPTAEALLWDDNG